MAAIEYPADLPEPSVADIQSTERRQLSEGYGPRSARDFQRDRMALQQVAWTFTPEQAESFQAWWSAVLLDGGAWFSARWPLPLGWVAATRKLLGTPAWQHVPTEYWRVTADCELRGTGVPPALPVLAGWNTRNAFGDWSFTDGGYTALLHPGA
ncbi:MAG: hypothetical protein ABI605_10855 [Rhizobacter sp.]